MSAFFSLFYGLAAYLTFLGTIVYTTGFVGNVVVPKSIDSGSSAPLPEALIVDALLLGIFAVQHSVMARPGFKRWWTKLVPPAVERSTYVLFASLSLALLCWQWRPIATPVWTVTHPAGAALLDAISALGWGLVFASTFMISHFELFGVHQVIARAFAHPPPSERFKTPGLYRHVRHPIYLGFLLAFWATPAMTFGHLFFAAAITGYIFIGIYFEERDLIAKFGDRYRRYRMQVGMLLPKANGAALEEAAPSERPSPS